MATTAPVSLLIANPQEIYYGDSGDTVTVASMSKIQGALDDASLAEDDAEETIFGALIGSTALKINKELGDVVLTLTLAEVYPSVAEALTGYAYTAPTSSAVGSLKRPSSAPTIDKMIVIEFEGGIQLVFHKADLGAKLADFEVKNGLLSFTLTCTAQSFTDESGVMHSVSILIPALTSE